MLCVAEEKEEYVKVLGSEDKRTEEEESGQAVPSVFSEKINGNWKQICEWLGNLMTRERSGRLKV